MAKLNEGDVIEGIFAIGLGLYIAEGKIDKTKLNNIRKIIEPKMFRTGKFSTVIVENKKIQKDNYPADTFNVILEVRLKEASVIGAFGKDFAMLVNKSSDIGGIDKKINSLIASVGQSNWSRSLKTIIDNFLENNKEEIITFEIIADGIAGESSGGDVKGDIDLKIYARTKNSRKNILSQVIPFSLKSESVTVANLSPYNGMKDIAKAFGLQWNDIKKYEKIGERATTPAEKEYKFKLIEQMYSELSGMILKNKSTLNSKAYDFLYKSIFGSDLANVVDIQKGKVKEITVDYFNILRANVKLDIITKGKNVQFIDNKTKKVIFQIRTKLRAAQNEAKFYLEVGQGIYSK